jgi:catechol 2,3-dioxygenase-like lactoylglutathione lyase family enzyme
MKRLACLATIALATIASAAQSAPGARPTITGIAFLEVAATKPAASDTFYRSLGYVPEHLGKLERFAVSDNQWFDVAPAQDTAPGDRLLAIGFTTHNASAMQRYLSARGVRVVDPLHNGRFAVLDPEGNKIVFVQEGTFHETPEQKSEAGKAPSHRIIHAGFIVKNPSAEDAFYRDVLGFRPYWRGGMTDNKLNFISLQVPDGHDWIEYMMLDKPTTPPTPEQIQRQFGMSDHFSLGVTRMNTVVAGLQANHCEGPNCTKTQMGRDGKVQLNVFDPDYTRIEYMEFQPSGPICCSTFTGQHPTATEDK